MFAGRATLAVQRGEVSVCGGTVNAASGPIDLAADDRCGGPLLLQPGAGASTVPLAASGPAAVLTLSRAAGGATGGPPSASAGDGAAAAAAAAPKRHHTLGFEVWLDSDLAAPAPPPPLPPLWHKAAGEIAASIQQQQQQQQGGAAPPVIAVCGPKKAGKSTFARLLANSLLSCHPCVAYLDTGGAQDGLGWGWRLLRWPCMAHTLV